MNPLLSSLAHSLWQAGILWLLAWMALQLLPARKAVLRYRVTLVALVLAMLAWLITWAALEQFETQDTSAANYAVPVSERLAAVIEGIREQTVHAISGERHSVSWKVKLTWQDWMQLAWGAGVMIGFFRVARACVSASRLRCSTVPLQSEVWLEDLEKVRKMLRCRAKVMLRIGEGIVSPVVVGIWRPAVIIPASLVTGVPADVMRAALAHEVAHVVRRDLLVHLLQMGTETLLFFNPFIWLLNRAVRREREACCDDMASTWSGGRANYSTALVWWVRNGGAMEATTPAAGLAMSGPGGWLRDRVHRLLDPRRIPRLQSGWAGAVGVTLLVALAFAITAGGIHFTVAQLSARDRVDLIKHLSAPYKDERYETAMAKTKDFREFSGVVVDEKGHILPGARWTVMWRPDLRRRDGKTDDKGRFTGSIEDSTRLLLRVRVEGFVSYVHTFEQDSMKDLRIVMRRGVDFAVKCVDESGTPVAGVRAGLQYDVHEVTFADSDATGMMRFQHVPDRKPAEIEFTVPGYERLRAKDVMIDAKAAPREFILKKAEPVEVTFLDEKDGSPVAGVKCRVVEMRPQIGLPGPVATVSDAQGRAVLHGLSPDIAYSYKGEMENRGVLFTVSPTKQKSLTVRMPRERRLKFTVIHLPTTTSHHLELQYSQRECSSGGGTSHRVVTYAQDGKAEFVLGGLMPGVAVDMHLMRQWFHSPVLEEELTEYTLDYAKHGRAPDVSVVVRFDAGRHGAPPEGEVFLNWKTPDIKWGWDGLSATIKNGRAEFSLPRGAKVKFRHGSMIGGQVDEEKEYTITGDGAEIVVPVTPAGMARVKVLDAAGTLLNVGQILVRNHSRENADTEIGVRLDLGARTWQVSDPLAFGEQYDVVAIHGLQTVISPVFKLNPSQPVQDVELRFSQSVSHRITVVDDAGRPVPDMACIAQYAVPGRKHLRASVHLKTDSHGHITLEYLPEQARGSFFLRAWSGTYVPQPAPLDLAGRQTTFTMQRGREIRGQVLDGPRGKGVRGVEISWQSDDGLFSSPTITSDDEGRFEFLNAPPNRVFLNLYNPNGNPAGKSWKGNHYAEPGQGESVFYLE